MVLQLGLDTPLTHNDSMISITVRTMEAPCNTDTVKVNASCQNEINLVAMLRPGKTPRSFKAKKVFVVARSLTVQNSSSL